MTLKCVECHPNIHKGFIEDKFMVDENCTACHNVNSWKSVQFDHERTGFKLEGVHTRQACASCHYKKSRDGEKIQKFEGLSKECSTCHNDSHVGQFAVNGKTECLRCHGFEDWKFSKFDHNISLFKLDGAHQKVECVKCHKLTIDERGTYIKYRLKSIECIKCHS